MDGDMKKKVKKKTKTIKCWGVTLSDHLELQTIEHRKVDAFRCWLEYLDFWHQKSDSKLIPVTITYEVP